MRLALFTHPLRDLDVVIHVGDMLVCGRDRDLRWCREVCQQTYQVTSKLVVNVGEYMSHLGRVIRRTVNGFRVGRG